MRITRVSIVVIFFILTHPVYSQQPAQVQEIIESQIEEIANTTDRDLDYSVFFEDLLFFYHNPININRATTEDLEKLQILNDFQIKSLQSYIEKTGPFLSIYEIQSVYGFDKEVVQKISPFIKVAEPKQIALFELKDAIKYGRHQLFIRGQQILEEQKGFSEIEDSLYLENPNSRYLGSPLKLYTRYKYNLGNKIYAGFTAEKDAGEEFFRGSNKQGFDFYSAHLQINRLGKIKTLLIGDYHLRFGQGLTLWSGLSFDKSPYVLNIKKNAQGIVKYSSTDENHFFRGIATTVSFNNLDITAFLSGKMLDANISQSDTSGSQTVIVENLQNSGLHTIPGQVEDKDAISETIFGTHLSYNHRKFRVGGTFVQSIFGAELIRKSQPYHQFDFTGKENTNFGLDYQFGLKNVILFGESSYTLHKGLALVNGALFNLSSRVSLSITYRDYQKNYHAFYSNAFSENTENRNEKGLYLGTEVLTVKNLKVSAYVDVYSFPWLKYRVNAPSYGQDYFVQADFFPGDKMSMYLKFKHKTKQININQDPPSIDHPENTHHQIFRYHLSYRISEAVQFRNRIELVRFTKEPNTKETGYLLYQDILYSPSNFPLSLSFRYAIFDTDTYNTRIYAYENDVLYSFSIPAYYSKGIRTYCLVKYTYREKIDLWLRYAQTYYADKTSIGSGLNEINGQTKSEIKVQVRITF